MLVQYDKKPGFFIHPCFPTLAIHPKGKFISVVTGKFLNRRFPGMIPYMVVDVPGDTGRTIHRLLALAFIECPGNPDEMQVNHKDGNKLNNRLDNLEWVTASENVLHAYMTGLRNDNRPIQIRHLLTGEEKEFYSLQEAARFFSVNGEKVNRYLNSPELYPFANYWNVRYKDGNWKAIGANHVNQRYSSKPTEITLFNPEENSVFLFESATAASEFIRYSRETVTTYAKKTDKPIVGGYKIYFSRDFNLDDVLVNDKRKEPTKPITPNRKPDAVIVQNLITGKLVEWESVEAFALSVDAKKNTIQKSMLIRDGKWAHYKLEYVKYRSPLQE